MNIFDGSGYKNIEKNILHLLQTQAENIPDSIFNSPRSIGDFLERLIRENLEQIIGIPLVNYQAEFERRAMADLAFSDAAGNYYIIDVKTHNLETKFNMPNLSSVERLARFYRIENNFFVVLKIDYTISNGLEIQHVNLLPIEHFDRDCLTVGALGRGQVQIANANKTLINRNNIRKDRMIYFCDMMIHTFYPKEVSKIADRIEYFKVEKEFWTCK